MEKENKLIIFEDTKIRRIWHNEEWFYVVEDVVFAITLSKNIKDYINKLRQRDLGLLEGYGQIVHTLKIETKGGAQKMNCSNTKGIFRIIQSLPSKRAEPFKMWLAQLAQERIEEIENPELAQNRVKEYYEMKGYPKSWIDKRLRGISIRQDLTDKWKNKGITGKKDYAILTNEIHKAVFDKDIQEHKNFKNIPKKSKINLRDHMTDLELIFTMLGEASTTELEKNQNPKSFEDHKKISKKGGEISKVARLKLEKETKKKVISKSNYLENKKELEN
jgi:hypothetical protein